MVLAQSLHTVDRPSDKLSRQLTADVDLQVALHHTGQAVTIPCLPVSLLSMELLSCWLWPL